MSAPANLRAWYQQLWPQGLSVKARYHDIEHATRLLQQAPNLTLNVSMAMAPPAVTWAFTFVSIGLQLGVFAIASAVTYHWHLGGGSSPGVVGYGFPLFMIGMFPPCVFKTRC
jgi:hypothetical protein